MPDPVDAYKLPAFGEADWLDRYDELEEVVRRAEADGVVTPLSDSEDEVLANELIPSRVATLRTRLFLLGYLGKDNGKDVIDKRLRQAIERFQQDAGLLTDRIVGPVTWGALEQLVSFEEPIDLGRWLPVDGQPGIVLRRAVEIRLHVLGLLQARHPRKGEKVVKALERFCIVADLLDLADARLEPRMTAPTLAALFDQDRIAERLADADDAFTISRPLAVSKKQAHRLLRAFIISNARVELWLHGFDVRPDGDTTFDSPDQPGDQGSPLYRALCDFWSFCGQSQADARRSSRTIKGNLFRQFVEIHREADETTDEEAEGRLYEAVVDAEPATRQGVWQHVKKIGSRIWDGIKRAWRWFKSLLRRAVKKIGQWIRNAARLLYRYAGRAFATVKKAIGGAIASIKFILSEAAPGSDAGNLVIGRDGDFDYYLFHHPSSDAAKVRLLTATLLQRAHQFNVTVRILGFLVGTLIGAMRKSALGGWFGLIVSLFRIRRRIRALREELAA